MSRLLFAFLGLVLVTLLSLAPATRSQPSLDYANHRIDQGWAALQEGDARAAQGDVQGAVAAWDEATAAARDAIVIGGANGVPFEHRPSGLFFLFARAQLNAADALIAVGAPPWEVEPRLDDAMMGFGDALHLVDLQHPRGSAPWLDRSAENLLGLATVHFMRGEFDAAAAAVHDALARRPNHPRLLALDDAIAYSLGATSRLDSRTGAPVPEAPRQGLSGERALDYAKEIAAALFGKWGNVLKMVMDDTFGSSG